jgi:hypothetical protein
MATNDNKPCDGFADLVSAYDALADLAHSEDGPTSPVWVLLVQLNREFRRLVDEADQRGLVS